MARYFWDTTLGAGRHFLNVLFTCSIIVLYALVPNIGEGATLYRSGREVGTRTLYKDLVLTSIGFKEEFYLKGRWRTYLVEDVKRRRSPLTIKDPNVVGRFEGGMTQAVTDLWNAGFYTADVVLWTGFPPRGDGGWLIQGRRSAAPGKEEEARGHVEQARRSAHGMLLRELKELRTRGKGRSSEPRPQVPPEYDHLFSDAPARDWRALHAVRLFTSGRCGKDHCGKTTWIRNGGSKDVGATIEVVVSGERWQDLDRGATTVRVPAGTEIRVGCTHPARGRTYRFEILRAGFLR